MLTIQGAPLPDLLPRLKARLCVRGFEDPDRAIVDRTSSTVSRSTARLTLAAKAFHDWVPRTVHVATAFLKGLPIDLPRPVHVCPPVEARAPQGVVWGLKKCAYGLTDAPRMSYERPHA